MFFFFFLIKPLVAEIKPCWIINMMAHIWQECFQPLEILMVTIIIWLGLSCCSRQLQKQHFLTELQLVNSVKLLAYEITDNCMIHQIVFNSPFQPHASCCGFSFSHLSRCQWLLRPGREDRSCQMFFLESTASRYDSSASHERWRHWPRWTRPRRRERLPPNRNRSPNWVRTAASPERESTAAFIDAVMLTLMCFPLRPITKANSTSQSTSFNRTKGQDVKTASRSITCVFFSINKLKYAKNSLFVFLCKCCAVKLLSCSHLSKKTKEFICYILIRH